MPVSCQKIPHWPEKKNLKLRARAFGPPPPWQPLDTTWENFGQHNSRRVVRQLLYGLVHIEVEFHTHCLVLQQMFNYAHRQ